MPLQITMTTIYDLLLRMWAHRRIEYNLLLEYILNRQREGILNLNEDSILQDPAWAADVEQYLTKQEQRMDINNRRCSPFF